MWIARGLWTPYARGDALIALGRLQDALQFLSRSKATLPGEAEYDIGALALLGVVHARLEQPKEAERVLTVVIPAAQNPGALSHIHHAQFHIGAILGLLGRKADAVHWLTTAADEGYPSFPRFSTDQSLAPLKGYPAYEALLNDCGTIRIAGRRACRRHRRNMPTSECGPRVRVMRP